MKTANIQRLIGALLLTGIMFTGCSKDNTLDEIVSSSQQEQEQESDPLIEVLKSIDGVRNVELKKSQQGTDSIYYFSFRQFINHENPDEGTFDQQVAISFKGFDKNVVLYTHGYAMSSDVDAFPYASLRIQLDANQVNVEHRYFGNSLPEPSDKMSFTYLNADQQAQDLHAIVQALKSSVFKSGKWASTGVSKDGITSALYAYYSDQYGWNDIDVFVPFCAPFITGSVHNGQFTCMNPSTGAYLEQVCGSGYPAGSVEAIAYQRLHDIPQYLCTNQKVRDEVNKWIAGMLASDYRKILEQYNRKSPMSTGDLEKDATAFSWHIYYDFLFQKFSYVQFRLWAPLVPDPAEALTSDEAMNRLCTFITLSGTELNDSLRVLAAKNQLTRSAATDAYDKYWTFINNLRSDNSAPYDVQAFKELGYTDYAYSTVDGNFLTKEQAFNVNEQFSLQKKFEGLYPQDEGRLMRSFRQWVATETTQNVIFVYAYNDPWTGARPDDAVVSQNPKTEMFIDPIATHNDYFLESSLYTNETKTGIINALNKFLK